MGYLRLLFADPVELLNKEGLVPSFGNVSLGEMNVRNFRRLRLWVELDLALRVDIRRGMKSGFLAHLDSRLYVDGVSLIDLTLSERFLEVVLLSALGNAAVNFKVIIYGFRI